MKAPLILRPSKLMSANRKNERNEDSLIRMSSETRAYLGLDNDKYVEVWPDSQNDVERDTRSRSLKIYRAYSEDLKEVKDLALPEDEQKRIGFVTTKTFDFIISSGKDNGPSVWVTDKISDLLIGADPEFLLVNDDGKPVRSYEHLQNSTLGSDGFQAEIRPSPKINIDKFIKEIHDILSSDLANNIQQFKWIALPVFSAPGIMLTMGGHIHFGSPKIFSNLSQMFNRRIYKLMVKVLDELLSVPLVHIETKVAAKERRKQYGYFGDYRTDHGRLEYRTPSCEWLSHPKIAGAVLGTAKAIVMEIFKIIEDSGFSQETDKLIHLPNDDVVNVFDSKYIGWEQNELMKLFGTTTNSNIIRKMLIGEGLEVTSDYVKNLGAKLKKMSTYDEFGKYINKFLAMLRVSEKTHASRNHDIKYTWLEAADKLYTKSK